MKLYPNVTIKLVQVQQQLITKSITAIRANNGPDIVGWVDDSLGEMVDSHSVILLDQYISQSYVTSTYTPPAAQAVQFNGHIWGVPETVEAVTIMYNKKLVSASQLPTTTDQMLEFEQSYAQHHPGKYCHYSCLLLFVEPHCIRHFAMFVALLFISRKGKISHSQIITRV